jgi:tetratricopeptide (TPR) repeat protein
LYEKQGQLELAIDQLRKAQKLSHSQVLQRKLAALLSRRGKELLDSGNTDEGYAYLQQAKSVSPESSLPAVTLRDLTVSFDQSTYTPKISGRIWNPTDKSISSMTIKVELFDTTNSKILWSKDQKVIDEFVPPLGAQESKSFEFIAGVPSKSGASEFRVYLDGNLYKTYPIGKKDKGTSNDTTADKSEPRTILVPPRAEERTPASALERRMTQPAPTPAPVVSTPQPPIPGLNSTPTPTATPTPEQTTTRGQSAEERTMKELDQ